MQTQTPKRTRNQTLECFKLIASVFVVFIHIKFPNRIGELMTCLARFAVPLFFTISGYFSYRVSSRHVERRMVNILKLLFLGWFVYFSWSSIYLLWTGENLAEFFRTAIPDARGIYQWLVLSMDPFYGHLWFLSALVLSYGILWVYLRFFEEKDVDYRPLYEIGAVLMFLQFLLDESFLALGVQIPFYAYRNAFLTGLPFLTLGLFLREYQQHLILAFRLTERKLIGLIAAALWFSVFEWYGIGTCDIYCGTVLAVIAMVLYAAVHPTVTTTPFAEQWICRLGAVSTAVYLLHLAVLDFYSAFIRWRIEAVLFEKEAWLGPILVALISILASAFCVWGWDLVKRIFKKK